MQEIPAPIRPNHDGERSRAAPWGVLLLTSAAAVLRLIHLGSKSLWADEAASLFIVLLQWTQLRNLVATTEANMALYYLLLRGWQHFGDSESWLRLLSAMFGIAVVPIVYWIGREIFSRRAAIVAALLLSINVFHVTYSQQARGYSLAVLLVTISFLAFFRSINSGGLWWQACYVLSSGLALYAHFFAALALLAQLVSLCFLPAEKRARLRPHLRLLLLIAVLAAPLAWFIVFRAHGQLNWVPPLTGKGVYHFFLYLSGSGVRFAVALISFAIALTAWKTQWHRREWTLPSWSFLAVLLWLFLPPFIAILISLVTPVFEPRFLIVSLPAAQLLIAFGLSEIRHRVLRYALVGLMVISAAAPLRSYYLSPGQEDWKGAVSYLEQHAVAGDVLLVPNWYCTLPLNYYRERSAPLLRLTVTSKLAPAPATGHVWIISCSAGEKAAAPEGYRALRHHEFTGVEVAELGGY